MMLSVLSRFAVCVALLLTVAHPASAQDKWPSRPIKLVVPLSAGGGVDLMARLVAARLSDQLGQRVLVENQGGGGGTIATASVARAAPDGYTLIFQSTSAAITPFVYKSLSYDGINGFAPVTLVSTFPLVAVVPANVPAKTLPEFIALVKANPGKYSYGSSGVGSITHLAGLQFGKLAGLDIVHVPYRGNSAVIADLIAGRVQLLFDGYAPEIGNIKAGTVRALGVSTVERSKALPDVPAIKEFLPEYAIPYWTAIFAPLHTPKDIIKRLSEETAIALKNPEVQRRLDDLGIEGVGSSPEAMQQFWHQQLDYYRPIVNEAKISIGSDESK